MCMVQAAFCNANWKLAPDSVAHVTYVPASCKNKELTSRMAHTVIHKFKVPPSLATAQLWLGTVLGCRSQNPMQVVGNCSLSRCCGG